MPLFRSSRVQFTPTEGAEEALQKSANLSDLANIAIARANLGVSGGVFTHSLNSPGWNKFPSGLIIQWGYAEMFTSNGQTYTGSTVFPVAFNSLFFVYALATGGSANLNFFGQIPPTPTLTSCVFSARNNVDSSGGSLFIDYLAFGTAN